MQLTQTVLASLLATLSLFPSGSQAHLGKGMPGHHIQKKHHEMATPILARAKMNDASFAKIETSATECKPYNYAPVEAMSKNFPTVWKTADIMPGDTAAQQLWAKVQASGIIPAGIKPKGTITGNRAGVNYDSKADPDCDWTAAKCTTPKHPNIPDDIVSCPTPHTWGLTYDDGPNCTHNAFYDYLKEQNQKASLYYIGSNVLDWPLQAQRGLTDGHYISVHTYSHPYMTALTNSQVFAELYYTLQAIKSVVGVTPTMWRPPYGDVDDRVRAIATALGLQTVIWTDDTSDYLIQPQGPVPTASINQNYANIIASATSPALETAGIIVLSHEINGNTMQEAMQEYPRIAKAFQNVVPVEVCHNITKPYQESITYPDFATYIQGTAAANRMPQGIPKANAIQAKAAQFTPSGPLAMKALGSAATLSGSALSSAAAANGTVGPAVAAAQGQSASGATGAVALQIGAVGVAAVLGAAFTLL